MNFKIFIDKSREEEVVVFAKERTRLTDAIEQLCLEDAACLFGYKQGEAVKIELAEVHCFLVEDNKVYALLKEEKLRLKCRLYTLEEMLPESFVKINQSCIANMKNIERFSAAFSGAMKVTFKNRHSDFVSRRNLKNVKERLGL